jgi:hypothetical protein
VGYGEGAIGVIDATTNKRLNMDYKLEEHPEGFQLETTGPRIFVNVAGKKHLAVIDRTTGTVTKWELGGAGANFPLTLDETNHRVFIGTRKPSRLVIFDIIPSPGLSRVDGDVPLQGGGALVRASMGRGIIRGSPGRSGVRLRGDSVPGLAPRRSCARGPSP